jgi:hypothetical protein
MTSARHNELEASEGVALLDSFGERSNEIATATQSLMVSYACIFRKR